MTYNRSEIFKRAWAIVRADKVTISVGLKKAWAEAKAPKSGKERCIDRLNTIISHSTTKSYCEMFVVTSDWENYGKSRTYFSIVEKAVRSSKHYVKRDYGYYDNISDTYVPGRNDLNKNYTFSGMSF